MNIRSTQVRSLPTLPQIPPSGRGSFVTEPIDYSEPETVETRLGSIPRNYETSSGSSRSTSSVLFEGEKEAANPRGRATDVWRPQPMQDQDGQVRMREVSKPVTVDYRNPLAEGIGKGLLGAGIAGFFGAWGGMVVSILSGSPLPLAVGALGGASVGGLVLGASAYRDASSEQVHLEWQKTDINEHELKGYTYRVREDETCTGTGDDRRCDSDYEHIFQPIIQETKLGEYYRPVVVRSKG